MFSLQKASGKPYCASFVTASPSTSHVALSTSILAVADVSQPFLHILSLDRLEASAHSHSVPEPVVSVAFSPCGTFCFSGGASGNLYVWAMASGQLVRYAVTFFIRLSLLLYFGASSGAGEVTIERLPA